MIDVVDGNFVTDETDTVEIGPCACPDRPHDIDTARVYRELPWDVLTEVGMLTGIAAYRRLVVGGIESWTFTDADGDPVPIHEDTVRRLRPDRMTPLASAINAVYERAKEPLPNVSSAPSPRSRRGSARQYPKTPKP